MWLIEYLDWCHNTRTPTNTHTLLHRGWYRDENETKPNNPSSNEYMKNQYKLCFPLNYNLLLLLIYDFGLCWIWFSFTY